MSKGSKKPKVKKLELSPGIEPDTELKDRMVSSTKLADPDGPPTSGTSGKGEKSNSLHPKGQNKVKAKSIAKEAEVKDVPKDISPDDLDPPQPPVPGKKRLSKEKESKSPVHHAAHTGPKIEVESPDQPAPPPDPTQNLDPKDKPTDEEIPAHDPAVPPPPPDIDVLFLRDDDDPERAKYKVSYTDDLLEGQRYNDSERKTWEENSFNGLLSMIGYAVGLSNIWRFPYLCYHYGGGAFLIPYFFLLSTCAVPIMYLEVIMGQFTQTGMVSVWKIAPIFRGVGICQIMIPILLAFYSNTILAWAMIFAYESFTSKQVPWVGCHHDWNTLKCRDIPLDFEKVDVKKDEYRAGAEYFRGRIQRKYQSKFAGDNVTIVENGLNKMWGLGGDERGLSTPVLELSIYLFFVYLIIFILLNRGFRYTGRAIWWSVATPYVIMVILLYRGFAVPGALNGLSILFQTNITKLWHASTWVAAGEQAFFSNGAGIGIHMTIASHNKFLNKNILRDTLITTLMNSGTSIVCAMIVFVCIGSIAYSDSIDEIDMDDIVLQGPDLIFEMCVDFLGRLPGATFFSFIFFLMILLMGFESTLGALCCSKESFFDVCGNFFRRNNFSKGLFVFVIIVICYSFGLSCVTRGGLHMFICLDVYTAGVPLLICTFLFSVGMSWIYGLREICEAVEAMTGKQPFTYFQICWKFITPLIILIIMILQLCATTKAQYISRENGIVEFKDWVQIWGHVYAHLPSLAIPIGVIWYWVTSQGHGFKQKFLLGISPNYEHYDIIKTGTSKRTHRSHYIYCVNWQRSLMRKIFKRGKEVHPESPSQVGAIKSRPSANLNVTFAETDPEGTKNPNVKIPLEDEEKEPNPHTSLESIENKIFGV